MGAQRSLYSILNVAPDAELVVIEAAYRALMKKYHPDQAAGYGDAAIEINRAFATLREPGRRAEYDRQEWNRQQEMLLARYASQLPVPCRRKRMGIVGWSGWIAAGILGGMLLLGTGSGESIVPLRSAGLIDDVAQPRPGYEPSADDVLLTPAMAAAIDADALAMQAHARATAERVAAAETASGGDTIVRPSPSSRPKPRRPQSPKRRVATASEREFLEREGYIY